MQDKGLVPTRKRAAAENRLLAMAHPLRADVFKILTQREASPSEITHELGLPRKDLPNVSQHTRYLVKLGCAEEVGERRVKGKPPAKLYKATERSLIDTGEWEELLARDPALAEHLLGEFMQCQLDDYVLAIAAKTLGEDEDFHMTRTRRVLDAEGLQESLEIYERARNEMDEAERRSAERRREDGADAVHVSSGFALFRVPPPARPDSSA